MREDYIFNFDYLKTIGGITKEQEEEIPVYEKEMYLLNTILINLEEKIMNCNT